MTRISILTKIILNDYSLALSAYKEKSNECPFLFEKKQILLFFKSLKLVSTFLSRSSRLNFFKKDLLKNYFSQVTRAELDNFCILAVTGNWMMLGYDFPQIVKIEQICEKK